MDADPENPADFGEDVLVTDALIKAGTGIAAADDEPAEDQWGNFNFYSAYCPVFDSKKEIAGIVGIDFDADWYDRQIQSYRISIIIFTILSVIIGSCLVFMITHRVRVRLNELDRGISSLSSQIDILMGELSEYSGFDSKHSTKVSPGRTDIASDDEANAADELESLSYKINAMQNDMVHYLDYLHTQAFTDSLTRVSNTSAYYERIRLLNLQIDHGTADFSVAVFDLNNLKVVNDNYGHKYGDDYIRMAASAISHIFGSSDTYRIGGDEFAVIAEGIKPAEMERRLLEVVSLLESYIGEESNPHLKDLSMAAGWASFLSEEEHSFREVFARADHAMYADKRRYHQDMYLEGSGI